MQPIRFILHFAAERHRDTKEVVNFCVYGETPELARLDEPSERNFATLDALMDAMRPANLPEETALAIRGALESGQDFACEVTEQQADAVRLGL